MSHPYSFQQASCTVLITGAVRSRSDFDASLASALSITRKTQEAKILISTWDSCLAGARQAAAEIFGDQCEFTIASSKDIHCDFAGNWIRQSVLLSKGLNLIAPDSFVVKMRTDKTEWATKFAEQIFNGHQLSSPGTDLFSERIIIPSALAFEPFFYNDMVYAGLSTDLLRLVPRHMQALVEQWVINPEQIFHVTPILEASQSVQTFFRRNHGLPHGHEKDRLIQRNTERMNDNLNRSIIRQSLLHLSDHYAFPADYEDCKSDYQEICNYFLSAGSSFYETISVPPPDHLWRHLRFNDGAKGLVVTSSIAVMALLKILDEIDA